MIGEIIGVTADGETFKFWQMYAFYNPVTGRVISQQIGRNGVFSVGDEQVLSKASPYGVATNLDAIEYTPNGEMKITRHSNTFVDECTQLSDVYERGETGEWELERQWRWTCVKQD